MSKFEEYIIDQEHQGLSIKEYLKSVQGMSGRFLQKLTRAKGIYLNGKRVILDKKLKYKDSLKILILQERLNIIPENNLAIDILYEDDSMLVVNKPAGLLVHPAGQTTGGTLLNYLAGRYAQDSNVNLHALHRLDRDTSGCVLFAKNAKTKQALEKDLLSGRIKRIYLAVVKGQLPDTQGQITAKIDKDPFRTNRRMVSEHGQTAITNYRVLESIDENTHLLELELLTGRTHQIRVHLTHIGLPILGDGMYGVRDMRIKRQMLHAVKMYFTNEQGAVTKELVAPVLQDMQVFIKEKK